MEEEPASECKHSGIIHSQHTEANHIVEQFTQEHGICYISSGKMVVSDATEQITYTTGDVIFFRKNYLAKFKKLPYEGENFNSVTVVFDTPMLKEFYSQQSDRTAALREPGPGVIKLTGNLNLMNDYFATLENYYKRILPPHLMELKTKEALIILLEAAPSLKLTLFDFGYPGKIDLEAFMLKNYKFNVEMKKLAFLTGRSLASFKRDFKKIFNNTPARWVHEKRLQEAHFLLKENGRKPSEVYHEIGFETLAHFSFSFKQHFGINPSALR